MSNTLQAKIVDLTAEENSAAETNSSEIISLRVSPNGYFIALFLITFFSGFLLYLEYDFYAIPLFVISSLVFPLLAWTDRIIFDGKRLTRTGFLPKFWARINNAKYRLRIVDIERVETQAQRALKRGGNVFYRYRTLIRGKQLRFDLASGGADYRQMIHKVFPLLSENILDNRSIELRDYLTEPKESLMKAEFAKIPSAEVLESSMRNKHFFDKPKSLSKSSWETSEDAVTKAIELRRLANELRLSGYLIQALEAFRRALVLTPKDAWLLFEFARCLHSFAGSERNPKLQRKAFAALRLAEKRGEDDGNFLERLGESYFQYGDWRRAYKVFNKAISVAEESFRSVRGLAEIALREGKIAHVIHHFGTANRLAETPALRRWTQSENDYFSRLNSDDDYMELEVSRVNMLENLENARKTSLQVALFSFPLIVFGLILEEELVANVGWAVSIIALIIWSGLILTRNMLSNRIPIELIEEE